MKNVINIIRHEIETCLGIIELNSEYVNKTHYYNEISVYAKLICKFAESGLITEKRAKSILHQYHLD